MTTSSINNSLLVFASGPDVLLYPGAFRLALVEDVVVKDALSSFATIAELFI